MTNTTKGATMCYKAVEHGDTWAVVEYHKSGYESNLMVNLKEWQAMAIVAILKAT